MSRWYLNDKETKVNDCWVKCNLSLDCKHVIRDKHYTGFIVLMCFRRKSIDTRSDVNQTSKATKVSNKEPEKKRIDSGIDLETVSSRVFVVEAFALV